VRLPGFVRADFFKKKMKILDSWKIDLYLKGDNCQNTASRFLTGIRTKWIREPVGFSFQIKK